jgi:hypothetical protein
MGLKEKDDKSFIFKLKLNSDLRILPFNKSDKYFLKLKLKNGANYLFKCDSHLLLITFTA